MPVYPYYLRIKAKQRQSELTTMRPMNKPKAINNFERILMLCKTYFPRLHILTGRFIGNNVLLTL